MKYLVFALFVAVVAINICHVAGQGFSEEEKKALKECCDKAGAKGIKECDEMMSDEKKDTEKCLSHCIAKGLSLVGEKDCNLNKDKLKASKMPDKMKNDIEGCFKDAKGSGHCDKCAVVHTCVKNKLQGKQFF